MCPRQNRKREDPETEISRMEDNENRAIHKIWRVGPKPKHIDFEDKEYGIDAKYCEKPLKNFK